MRREVFFFARKIPQPYLSLSWLAGSHYYGKLACHDMSYSRNPKKSFNDYFLGLSPSRWPFFGELPGKSTDQVKCHMDVAGPTKLFSHAIRRFAEANQTQKCCTLQRALWDRTKGMSLGVFTLYFYISWNLPLEWIIVLVKEWQHTLILQRSCLAHPFRLLVLRYQPWSLSCGGALGACVGDAGSFGGFCPS